MSKTPECDKMAKVRDQSQSIGEFLEWLSGKGIHLGKQFNYNDVDYSEFLPYSYTTEELLAEFFEIDLNKVEEERRALLEELRL
jgi:hypothetical protein